MSRFDQIYRKVALTIAGNSAVERLLSEQGKGLAGRFVAGDTPAQAIEAIHKLARSGILHNMDLLGEFVSDPASANANADAVLQMLNEMHAAGIRPYNSIKLSALGQGQQVNGHDLGESNARRIVARAKEFGGFINLDMEDHTRVDITLATFRRLAEEFGHAHVGTVLQSYLYRSEEDLRSLEDLRPNLRIVKGAYLEPATVAMQNKPDIDAAYRRLVYEHLKAGHYCNVATHDHHIIYDVMHFALAYGIPKSQFEFQMLYGVREDFQKELAAQGYTVRSYIPYGTEWYGYYSRRIAERPQNVMFVLRGLL
ncbi:proline dehydrogenase family protein [Deinococcus lacus]|uniref:proline dehydrogenase n=1 Tax=Deinococcus lacus TaxID=392561 RepID=A0ABW1YA60_9DEIO